MAGLGRSLESLLKESAKSQKLRADKGESISILSAFVSPHQINHNISESTSAPNVKLSNSNPTKTTSINTTKVETKVQVKDRKSQVNQVKNLSSEQSKVKTKSLKAVKINPTKSKFNNTDQFESEVKTKLINEQSGKDSVLSSEQSKVKNKTKKQVNQIQ